MISAYPRDAVACRLTRILPQPMGTPEKHGRDLPLWLS